MSNLFGVYVHWPFCAAKCPYCDFNSHVADTIDHEKWADAYEREIEYYASLVPDKIVNSVFFGGGTPSLMKPKTVERVINAIRKNWRFANDVEITLEANPTSVEVNKFKDFKVAGVNRVSLGVQSLRDDDLKFLGRQHSAAQALQAIDVARTTFDRFSFDLIYARPNHRLNDWEQELKSALKHAGEHMSLYQLTIEPGTQFHTMYQRKDFDVPTSDEGGELYELTQDIMRAHGLPAYEISNHASEGQESRHNLIYWRYGDYVGIGPGAHGRLRLNGVKKATRAHRAPDAWMEKVFAHGHGAHPFDSITPAQEFEEKIMMGLRLREGIVLDSDSDNLDPQRIQAMVDEGMLVVDKKTLRPTIDGMQRLNGVLNYLLT